MAKISQSDNLLIRFDLVKYFLKCYLLNPQSPVCPPPNSQVLLLFRLERFPKAFNRMSHQLLIQDLFDMKVPGWLLLILISYLTERKIIIKFRGVLSGLQSLFGSFPQGAVLGVILFIIYFNGAALRPDIPRPVWPFF